MNILTIKNINDYYEILKQSYILFQTFKKMIYIVDIYYKELYRLNDTS